MLDQGLLRGHGRLHLADEGLLGFHGAFQPVYVLPGRYHLGDGDVVICFSLVVVFLGDDLLLDERLGPLEIRVGLPGERLLRLQGGTGGIEGRPDFQQLLAGRLDAALHLGEPRPLHLEIGLRLLEGDAIIDGIDLENRIVLFHKLIVLDMEGEDRSRNLGGHDVDVAVHKGVIGRHMGAPVLEEKEQRHSADDQHHGEDREDHIPFLEIAQCHDSASLPAESRILFNRTLINCIPRCLNHKWARCNEKNRVQGEGFRVQEKQKRKAGTKPAFLFISF